MPPLFQYLLRAASEQVQLDSEYVYKTVAIPVQNPCEAYDFVRD
jgi:hypothetical protein